MSVVVPFAGGDDDARELADALAALDLAAGDELIVADNSVDGAFEAVVGGGPASCVRATGERSSYHARNVGAAAAGSDWLLFVDADCRPQADLIAAYFAAPIPDAAGALAGAVLPLTRSSSLAERYQSARTDDKQAPHLRNPYRPFGVTANLLVRRDAWRDVGGFLEGIRSSGDADFCWRIQDAGWTIERRAAAIVRHLHRETIPAYLRVHARYGAGRRWLGLRHPGAATGVAPRRALRGLAGAVRWTLAGQPERGLFRAIDATVVAAETVGYALSNAAPGWPGVKRGGRRVALMADRFPKPSETFVANEARALADLGVDLRVEARSRPERPALGAAWGLDVRYREDAGIAREAAGLAWLAARHPVRCAADLAARRRWQAEEKVGPMRVLAPLARSISRDRVAHLHVHFARRAALDALRLNRLLGVPFSVTAHAWDIFREPCNLVEKLEGAAFVTTGCDYNVNALRQLVGPEAGSRIHRVVMGVDPGAFSRETEYDGRGTVLAIGRLVEKKGFDVLIDAAARLRDAGVQSRAIVVGDGPLRDQLDAQRRRLDVADVVDLAGSKSPAEVREQLEGAAILAMPAVIAADGDRDSMPVVVKEALAMAVPVVATDEVGLPEVVRDEWGRLVPPGDAEALAAALAELLALPPARRAEMGARGRRFVLENFTIRDQTRLLLELIEAS